MSDKLTGPEGVVALMQGKSIRHKSGSIIKWDGDSQLFYTKDGKCWNFSGVLENDWELVPEPMVWEGEDSVEQMMYEVCLLELELPLKFYKKRVKVRVEEIL